MKHQESNLQAACVQWFRLQYPQHTIFAIPNGGNRSAATGAMMKREGVLAGVADLFIMVPSGGYHGLFIEMKTPTGKVQKSQSEFAAQAFRNRYLYMVIRSVDDFMAFVKAYLELDTQDVKVEHNP
jgi:hypothetical protein